MSLKKPAVERYLAGQGIGARALANVRIRERSRFFDVLVTGLTLGLVVPRSVTIEGVAVQ